MRLAITALTGRKVSSGVEGGCEEEDAAVPGRDPPAEADAEEVVMLLELRERASWSASSSVPNSSNVLLEGSCALELEDEARGVAGSGIGSRDSSFISIRQMRTV